MSDIDKLTRWANVIDGAHHEIHEGDAYNVTYNVENIGAMTTPDDMIQISWRTPNKKKHMHMVIYASCSAAALYKFTEGWNGAGVSPTGALVAYNRNRNFQNDSVTFNYDATAVTGGVLLEQQTITAGKFGVGESRAGQEWVLRPNRNYAVSLYLNGAGIATLDLNYYYH